MINVRAARLEDAAAIADIYNQGIRGRQATFETRERTPEDIHAWFADTARYPLLVAERDGVILGWVHASGYRARECYAGIAEFSVYVHTDARGQGVGAALMPPFLLACEHARFWKVLSRIFPENNSSRALCQKMGFREVGVYEKHAQLDGIWRDVVIVEYLISGNLR
jgi:phosphinothricin acetyltransferase